LDSNIKYSEQELVAMLVEHNEQSFSYLYDNYSGALFGIIKGVIPDEETVRDVLQEVFINIWNKIGLYDASKGRLFTWMMNIARNAAIDKLRSRSYQDGLKNRAIPENVDINIPGATTVQHTDDIGLRKVLARLKEEHRILIELSYFQGYTHEEISKRLDIPLGTVKTRIRSALTHLRTMIQ
jgi:RNA polymerase sigma factor (sigma-70 family)